MMDIVHPEIQEYANQATTPESELLASINRETYAKVLMPRMLSGHYQGRLLAFLSRIINPKHILELGTYTGYSAICMCEGLQPDGKLITIDKNEELEDRTRSYFKASGYADRIDYRVTTATKVLPTLNGPFDLVFIDADKVNYLHYYHELVPKMRPGGLMILDNVLWSGKVLLSDEDKKMDDEGRTLKKLSSEINQDARVMQVLLPVRDGLLLVQKL